jgi:hypothetical protein
MPSRMMRSDHLRGRQRAAAGGSNGARMAHSASDRSRGVPAGDGYGERHDATRRRLTDRVVARRVVTLREKALCETDRTS